MSISEVNIPLLALFTTIFVGLITLGAWIFPNLRFKIKNKITFFISIIFLLIACNLYLAYKYPENSSSITQTTESPSSITSNASSTPMIGDFTIVVSTDERFWYAQETVNIGEQAGFQPKIYKIGKTYYTLIGRYNTSKALETDLETLKGPFGPGVYSINMQERCPYISIVADQNYYLCSNYP